MDNKISKAINAVKVGLISVCLVGISFASTAQKHEMLGSFNEIDAFGRIELRLVKGNNDSILIEAGNYDAEKVHFEVESNCLKIRLLTEFPSAIKVVAQVNYKKLQKISVGGGVKVYNRGAIITNRFEIDSKSGSEVDLLIKTDSVKAVVNKGAFLRLSGESTYVELTTSTGGDYRATALKNKITVARMNGGTAEVSTDSLLNVKAKFKARLLYANPPARLIKKTKFGGEVGLLEQ